ncbi:helix-turn-helix transcriptional regulator [Chitinophaga qingshengii]|uniref:Helix-turn-helix transcriptional regulator n=1 Tax=Chitinophaga qingshengii TaxID=1569794 RepID=A0ABR7TY97_9BACT|nr:AraC family transcriptional regulator [Chitinophaga qingshengii]MBC9934481.1 helix-turn-helix transcriptional regulator [Chitinophaga qingshengii]
MSDSNTHTTAFRDAFLIPEGEVREFRMPLPEAEGTGRFVVCQDMAISDGHMVAGRPALSWEHYNEQAFVELNFVMSGQLYQTQEGLLNRQLFRQGYSNLLFNPCSWERNELADNKGFRNLGIYIKPEKVIALLNSYTPELQPFADKIAKGTPFVMHSPAAYFTPQLQYSLDHLWDSPASTGLKRLHFETQILQLFGLQCASLLPAGKPSITDPLRAADQERLHYARQYLLTHLTEPPSLGELSRICGLNEFKLKKGFRLLFGQSVFGFVGNERLELARQQILQGEHNISEIAYGLGYTHPQHFHRAFKKKFGITPMGLLK